jgi:predicted RNA-binding protein
MKYWLCVTNAKNWKTIKEKKIWGVSERNKGLIGRISVGDILIFYVKPKKISGVFKAATELFKSREKIFDSKGFSEEETFPYRVRLEPLIVPKTSIAFEELVPNLTFVVSKVFWTGYVRRAMRAIPREDYEKIKALLERI